MAHASNEPQRVTLLLPDPIIHGHFTSDHLRVRHELRIVFHRKWFGKKVEWSEEVEIFHRDVGWETRGEEGILEIVRGQEGDYWPDRIAIALQQQNLNSKSMSHN